MELNTVYTHHDLIRLSLMLQKFKQLQKINNAMTDILKLRSYTQHILTTPQEKHLSCYKTQHTTTESATNLTTYRGQINAEIS